MTLSRRHKVTVAFVALLAFLSQGAFAALAGHVHAGGDASEVSVEVIHTAHDPAHVHHAAATDDDHGVVVHPSDTACEESRACLCCIGSCASLLPGAVADAIAAPVSGLRFGITRYLTATTATSLYRPPIPA